MRLQRRDDWFRIALNITLRKYPVRAALVLIAVAAGAVLSAWPSLILRGIVDGPLSGDGSSLWRHGFSYLGALAMIGLGDLIREYGAMVFGQNMLLNIRILMLERLRRLPMSWHLGTPVGETMSRFSSDIEAVNTLFDAGIISAAADLLKIGGLIAALFSLSPPLGWLAVGTLPFIWLLSDFFRRNIYRKQKAVRERVSDINTGIREIYAGMKVIKGHGLERTFASRFEPLLERHRLAMNANSIYDAWFPVLMQVLRAIVIALALLLGAKYNLTPIALGLSLGSLAASADLFIRLFDPIEATAAELQTIQQAMAGIGRIRNFFNQKPETFGTLHEVQEMPTGPVSVEIREVGFSYGKGASVLEHCSLTISAGEKVALAGRTGSGKTTLLHLVAGLYPVANGSIRINGLDPFRLPPASRRRLIGIVPQRVVVFNGTFADNVTLRDNTLSMEQVKTAIDLVGLSETVQQLPEGLNTLLGEGASKLSFGQEQLLSLARAIVADPPLLLLDEMTSGLDALTEQKVLNSLRRMGNQKTILTVSHRLSGLLDADTVHVMERGNIVESGSPQVLAGKEGWYARYKRLEDNGWQVP